MSNIVKNFPKRFLFNCGASLVARQIPMSGEYQYVKMGGLIYLISMAEMKLLHGQNMNININDALNETLFNSLALYVISATDLLSFTGSLANSDFGRVVVEGGVITLVQEIGDMVETSSLSVLKKLYSYLYNMVSGSTVVNSGVKRGYTAI